MLAYCVISYLLNHFQYLRIWMGFILMKNDYLCVLDSLSIVLLVYLLWFNEWGDKFYFLLQWTQLVQHNLDVFSLFSSQSLCLHITQNDWWTFSILWSHSLSSDYVVIAVVLILEGIILSQWYNSERSNFSMRSTLDLIQSIVIIQANYYIHKYQHYSMQSDRYFES